MKELFRKVFDIRYAPQALVVLFATALFVRLIGLAVVPETNISTNADEAIIGGARLILDGQFVFNQHYPMLIPPLTAIFTSAVQLVFGDHLLPVKVAQVVLDSLTVVIVYLVGRSLFNYPVAVLAGAFLAVYPFSVFAPLYIGSEALFTFLLALFTLTAIIACKRESAWLYLAAGLCLGLATMTRGTTQYFPVVVIAFMYWKYRPFSARFLMFSAVFLIGFIGIVAPWTVRNLVVLDSFIVASTPGLPILNGSSEEFWVIRSRNAEYPKYFQYLKEEKGISVTRDPSWVEKDRFYKRAAIEKYKERWNDRPLSYIPFLATKFARMWYATETGNNHLLIGLINSPIYLLALFGLYFALSRSYQSALLLVGILAYFCAVNVAVFSLFRYMLPVMPFVVLFACHGFLKILEFRFAVSWARADSGKT